MRASRKEKAVLRKSVRLFFNEPDEASLKQLVRSFERIQGRVVRPAQLGYLIRCLRIHGPATVRLLERLYDDRGTTDDLLLALETAPPTWSTAGSSGGSAN